jgi:prepilin peptidase CpaA
LIITAIAAVTDARTGHIPNWLTLPPLVIAPLVWCAYGGLWRLDRGSLLGSLGSMLLCSIAPLILWRVRAMGAGDVKLFAAVGALALVNRGLEAQFYASCAISLFACAKLAWEGKLLRTLANTLFLTINPVLPKKHRRPIAHELMTKMRFGVAIFVGTLVAVLASNQTHGLL